MKHEIKQKVWNNTDKIDVNYLNSEVARKVTIFYLYIFFLQRNCKSNMKCIIWKAEIVFSLASRSRLNSSSACVSVLYNEMKRSGAAGELVHVRLENVLIRALLHVCVFSQTRCVLSVKISSRSEHAWACLHQHTVRDSWWKSDVSLRLVCFCSCRFISRRSAPDEQRESD